MAEYSIGAPDGKTYKITGPPGASQQDVEQEVMRQNPHLGGSPSAPPDIPGVSSPTLTAQERGQRIEAPESWSHWVAREGLPLAGMIAGGAVGAPLGPLGAAGGGVGGYALGRQYFRIGEAYFNPHRGPQTPLETAGEVAKDIGTGAGIEALGPLLGRVIPGARSAFQRLAGSEPPSIARDTVLEAARRQQIPLTVSAESGSKMAGALERFPERSLLGGSAVPTAREATREGAQAAVGRVAESVGGGIPSEVGGAAVQQDVAGRVGATRRDIAGRMRATKQDVTQGVATGKADLQQGAERLAGERRATVDQAVDAFSESLGGTPGLPRTEAGGAIQAGAKTVERQARKTAAEMYQNAYASAPPDAAVAHTKTAEVANALLEQELRLQGVARPAVARPAAGLAQASGATPEAQAMEILGSPKIQPSERLLQDIIEQYGLQGPTTRPLTDTVEIMQRLRGAIRRQTDDSTRRGIRSLADALSQDIDAFAAQQGGQFANRLRQADAFYRTEVAQDFARGGALRNLTQGRPGQVARQIFSMRDPDAAGRLMARLPEAEQAQVRRGAFETLVQRSTRNGEIDPLALGRNIDAIAPDVRRIVFGPNEPRLLALRQTLSPDTHEAAVASLRETSAGAKAALRERGRSTIADLRAESAATKTGPEATLLRLSPDQVVRSLTRGAAGNVGDLPVIWPKLATETQGRVRQSLIQSGLDEAVRDGVFSPARFLSWRRRIPDDVLPVIMGENPTRALDEITHVLQRVERIDPMTSNVSGTAQALRRDFEIMRGATAIGGVMLGHGSLGAIAADAALYAVPPAIGRFMTSNMARKLFTPQGLATIPERQKPAAALLRWLLVPVSVPRDDATVLPDAAAR